MDKTFKIVNGDISDGYHTFDELYEHRCLLFIRLCLTRPGQCLWREDFNGWFALYCELPEGQISYHIPTKFLYLIEDKIPKTDVNPWDGHTSVNVLNRLQGRPS